MFSQGSPAAGFTDLATLVFVVEQVLHLLDAFIRTPVGHDFHAVPEQLG